MEDINLSLESILLCTQFFNPVLELLLGFLFQEHGSHLTEPEWMVGTLSAVLKVGVEWGGCYGVFLRHGLHTSCIWSRASLGIGSLAPA